ncbi:hypothetical protein [Leptolyngbya sp. PCC 6406]|uniref:hypothetical protein n=1 Tax=Leptolyngbya sp. PCC 6406 TaxID=1173264 RepID=UPI0002AC3E8F|nr:hypothetical protein [Leptolyngbya sp. PCC 6406]
MTSITINLGDAFLIDTPPNGEHLYIAIAQTSGSNYLFVNVTTRRPNSEATCVLMPGSGVAIAALELAKEMLTAYANLA